MYGGVFIMINGIGASSGIAIAKAKGKYKGGKKKLSDQQIQEIKAVVNNRKTNISLLAKHYGITRQTIYNLIK